MKKHAKLHLPALALSLVALTSAAHAAYDDGQMRNLENRVSALEKKKNGGGMINPSGRPQVKDGADLFVTGDFLWWKGTQAGLPYAIKTKNSDSFLNTGTIPHHKVKTPNFGWKPGFRIGLGYNMPHDGWDLYANWTRFYDRASSHVNQPSGGLIFPTWIHPANSAPAQDTYGSAISRWRMHLNVIDLDLGREFFVSKWLTLRPFVGLRNAWVRQRYNIEYLNGQISPSISSSLYQTQMRNNFWGLGLRAGLNTQWGLGGGWSFYGDAAISLLYGKFSVKHNEYDTPFLTGVQSTAFKAREKYNDCKAISDLALGLRWDTMMGDDRCHLGIQAGWENHVYFEQNQFMHFANAVEPGVFFANQGDLTFNGLVVSARLDF